MMRPSENRKIAAFDVEIAKEIPDGESDWTKHAPLGIACASIAFSDSPTVMYEGVPQMSREACTALVVDLLDFSQDYTLVTFGGAAFDFHVLALESGAGDICARLARLHTDLMFLFLCARGHRVSLDKVLAGAGLGSKVHEVMLRDGTVMQGMGGAKAPQLWAQGEYEAVKTYLRGDVERTLSLAQWVDENKAMRFISGSGNKWDVPVPGLISVRDALTLPLPDTSWMKPPLVTRESCLAWTTAALGDGKEA